MLSSRLPKQSNITKERKESIDKFNHSLYKIFDEVLKDYNEEKKRTAHLSGFKRTLDPEYRVAFPSAHDIKECRTETQDMLSSLKSKENKRINSTAISKDSRNPTFDPLKPRLESKRKYNSDESVDFIENTSFSKPMSSNSNKKLKLTSVKAKDIPDSISQYNFKSGAANSLEKTFKNKTATPNNITDSIHHLETMNTVMDGLESEYREKVSLLKERKQVEQEKLKKDQDLRLIQTRIGFANKPKSRFQNSPTESRFQSAHTESRFEGHRKKNMSENDDESESD